MKYLLILSTIILLTTNGCDSYTNDPVVFSINGEEKLKSEFLQSIDKKKFKAANFENKRIMINNHIREEIIFQEHEKRNTFENEKKNSKLNFHIKNLTVDKIIQEEIWEPILSDSSLRILYKRLKKEIGISHIIIPYKGAKRSSTNRSKEEAINLISKIRSDIIEKKIDFESAARKYSEDPSSLDYGRLGYVQWGSLFEPIQSYAFSMDLRKIPNPIQSDFGYHLVYIYGMRMNDIPIYDEYIPELKKFLQNRKGPEFNIALQNYELSLKKKFDLILFKNNILKLFNLLASMSNKNLFNTKTLLTINFIEPLFSINGSEVNLDWFRTIIQSGTLVSQSNITDVDGLTKTLEHIVYRSLLVQISEKKPNIWHNQIRINARSKLLSETKLNLLNMIKIERMSSAITLDGLIDSIITNTDIYINNSVVE